LENISGKARVDHARVLDVVVGEDPAGDYENRENYTQNRQADRGSEKPSLNTNAQNFLPWAELLLSRKTPR